MAKVKGYSTFLDIQDDELRTRNQAVVLANIFEDNLKGNTISNEGAVVLLSYFREVPEVDRVAVFSKFKSFMEERGFTYAS